MSAKYNTYKLFTLPFKGTTFVFEWFPEIAQLFVSVQGMGKAPLPIEQKEQMLRFKYPIMNNYWDINEQLKTMCKFDFQYFRHLQAYIWQKLNLDTKMYDYLISLLQATKLGSHQGQYVSTRPTYSTPKVKKPNKHMGNISEIHRIIEKEMETKNSSSSDDEQKSSEEEDEGDLCVVCLDKEKLTIFLPCAHQICCTDCGEQVEKCPICQGEIQQKIKPFRC